MLTFADLQGVCMMSTPQKTLLIELPSGGLRLTVKMNNSSNSREI